MTVGLVLTGRNNIFTVQVEEVSLLCTLRGKRLIVEERAYNPLAPGDRVELGDVDLTHATGVIERRLERRNSFMRFNRKKNAPQTLAANLDRVICVTSVAKPGFTSRFVDRFLALAEDQGLDAAVVVNKADLGADLAAEIVERYRRIGYRSLATSSVGGQGIDELRAEILTGMSVFIGQSGVGKSTLLNLMFGHAVQKVRSVSERYGQGRHTTNAANLVQDGILRVVDTPGVRDLDVRTIDSVAIAWCFADFRPFLGLCGHSDCVHMDEPDCAVQNAVADGTVSSERYESYVRLYSEVRAMETSES